MNANEVKNLIKQHGYWEVVFTPLTFNPTLISDRTTCKQLLQKSTVRLRGWDYPHFPTVNNDEQKIYLGADHCEAFIDWGNHKEVLRLYQSGLFVHYLALFEDWMSEDRFKELVKSSDQYDKTEPGSALSFVSAIYSLTEIYEFLRRLASDSIIYDNGVRVEIKLNGIGVGRRLESFDPGRIGLFGMYTSNTPDVIFPIKEISKEDILNSSRKFSLEAVKYLFETFGWENMPMHIFEQDQQNLIERRF